MPPWPRRRVLAVGSRLVLGALLAGCAEPEEDGRMSGDRAAQLTARPGDGAEVALQPVEPGDHPLGLVPARDPVLHVPPGLSAGQAAGLVVVLHGAGGSAAGGLALLQPLTDDRGLLLLAPASRGPTWDAVRSGYGPDVGLLDRALATVFRMLPVDPGRIAVAGFSDGASYALGLGVANGRLLRRVVAFSPGFIPPAGRSGRPPVFVSHGDGDDVLPIGRTSRRIVPALQDDGYDVTYREFAGGHTVPPGIAGEGLDWLGWDRAG